ncbi:MAG: hypothetical protein ACI9LV_000689 [Candidatus Nanohaloarchaea archaeon]|jgi:uncharacterized membrane protein YiaA
MTEEAEDRFGLPKMTTNQEVAVSFTLFVLGTLLVLSGLYPLSTYADLGPAFLGVVMMGAGYLFAIESIRELEEKDHFLSRKLMNKD